MPSFLRSVRWLGCLFLLTLAGCDTPEGGQRAGAPEPTDGVAPSDVATAPEAPHADAAEATPQRLRPIMQQLAADFAGLSQALWMQNLPQVQRHAEAIAEHPHVAPEEMQRIQSILGGEMARFVSYDEQVHDAAVRLAEAAAQGETDEVLSELNEVQRGCVACHSEFRERLLSN